METGAIFNPGTKEASFWFSGGTIIPLIPCFLALIQIGRIPFTGRRSPSRLSSPMSIILSRKWVSTWRSPHRIATAMGRSNAAPSVFAFTVDGMGEFRVIVRESMKSQAEQLIKGKEYV